MKISLILASALLIIIAYACQTEESLVPNPDAPSTLPPRSKMLRFEGYLSTTTQDWYRDSSENIQILEFDPAMYPGVKSAVFSTQLRTISRDNYSYAELFNVDQKIRIAGTVVRNNVLTYEPIETEDILQSLPEEKVSLAVRVRSENEGLRVSTNYHSYLILYY